ncbi:MAG TPA: response regulator [Candidatus Methylomirabilis sp.]|nr:response regulator [Candidatus Methylomirabilis sp.]
MTGRILVIDDEDHIRRVMRMTLEAAGYEVGEAADGPRGLEAFGDGSGWDAVLLDQRMPGMDGLETLRRIKGRRADARVIMVTAYASIELAVDAMKLGAMDFVRKPMTPEIVRNAVTAALSRPGAAPAPPLPLGPERPPAPLSSPIVRLTLNGFRLWPAPEMPGAPPAMPARRLFFVQHPEGWEQEVVVEIDAGMVDVVERAIGRRLPLENAFWTWLAERALNNSLWMDGKVPAGGRLALTRLDPDELQMAVRWARGPE